MQKDQLMSDEDELLLLLCRKRQETIFKGRREGFAARSDVSTYFFRKSYRFMDYGELKKNPQKYGVNTSYSKR